MDGMTKDDDVIINNIKSLTLNNDDITIAKGVLLQTGVSSSKIVGFICVILIVIFTLKNKLYKDIKN